MTSIPMLFEILVTFLLIITIAYCFVLDRKLRALRSGQDGVRQSIADLVQATSRAEAAMHGLSATSKEIQQELDEKMLEARTLARHLTSKPMSELRNKPEDASAQIDKTPEPPKSGALMGRLKKSG